MIFDDDVMVDFIVPKFCINCIRKCYQKPIGVLMPPIFYTITLSSKSIFIFFQIVTYLPSLNFQPNKRNSLNYIYNYLNIITGRNRP